MLKVKKIAWRDRGDSISIGLLLTVAHAYQVHRSGTVALNTRYTLATQGFLMKMVRERKFLEGLKKMHIAPNMHVGKDLVISSLI